MGAHEEWVPQSRWVSGRGGGPRSLKYSRAQGRAIPREIRQQIRMAPPPMTHPSPQASCAVDTVDSSGWTALHHAGGYSPASPWPPWPPEAELGDCSTWGSGDVPGTYSTFFLMEPLALHYHFSFFFGCTASSLHHSSLWCTGFSSCDSQAQQLQCSGFVAPQHEGS